MALTDSLKSVYLTAEESTGEHTIYFASTTQLRSSKNYDLGCLDNDTTGFYVPSMAHNALPRHPWRGIVVCGYNSNSH